MADLKMNITIADDLLLEMKKIGVQHGCSATEVLREFVKLGLVAMNVQKDPSASFLIRVNDEERKVILFGERMISNE